MLHAQHENEQFLGPTLLSPLEDAGISSRFSEDVPEPVIDSVPEKIEDDTGKDSGNESEDSEDKKESIKIMDIVGMNVSHF
jgi:hypothetical protein